MSYRVEYKDIGRKEYKDTWDYQEIIFERIIESKKSQAISSLTGNTTPPGTFIIVEHPHVYTLGRSGSQNNLLIDQIQLKAHDATFYRTDRGGDITYHGPGQIVGYPIFDLEMLRIGLKDYVWSLEEVIIKTLSEFNITASRLEGGTGVWLDPSVKGRARKICAIGVKASKFVTMHGFAFNINTDLTYFSYINPCGFTDKGVTSLEKELGYKQDFNQVKEIVKGKMSEVFDLEYTG